MALELTGAYDPSRIEDPLYRFWLEQGYFKSRPNPDKKPYVIVIPPPNVTGMLHMGHILNNTIQDVLVRYHRMNGRETCWIPGTDHASIATETKVVQYLADKGIKKTDIGREKFLEYAWEWKEKYGGIIISQLKKLGASCDWDRERFTMDAGYYRAVIHAFVKLFRKGLIYKGYRLVNWCPVSKSAISDEEVYYREVDGKLYYFKYPVQGAPGQFLEIATTRPETMLGDTAVAVNPSDPRYKKLVGKKVLLPIVDREIPVIADPYVDPEFGSGVVKITPAHDPNDYAIGEKYNLEFVNILNPDATLNDNAPEDYRGLDRFEAREAVIEKMQELKLVSKIENYRHKVGYSERGHVPIEPYLSEQWFMKMGEIVKPAVEAVRDGRIEFFPDRWHKVYFHWLDNVKDWCISRQLWWGHRIPVYTCPECGYYNAYEEAPAKCEKCGGAKMTQDDDVLDTWASSWLWPFAVHKWPDPDEDLKYYYPTDTLVTAPDIIFFWVARMIVAGFEFMGEIPFRKVYFTGLIRDEQGRKMSKSLGNSPDPLDVIAKHGTDALRYTITRLAPLGNDILYSDEKCQLGRNFCNKIWNVSKFIFQYLGAEQAPARDIRPDTVSELDAYDRWILTRYQKTVGNVRAEIEGFRFNDATVSLYDFLWSEFCDWYVEISKVAIQKGSAAAKNTKLSVLAYILDGSLRLLHPFMPFITEHIYRNLPGYGDASVMVAPYPESDENLVFEREERAVAFVQSVIAAVRNVRGEQKIPPNTDVGVKLSVEDLDLRALIGEQAAVVKKLAKIGELEFVDGHRKTAAEIATTGRGFEAFVSLEGIIDTAKERERVAREMERTEAAIRSTEAKLANRAFTDKAPAEVVRKEKDKLDFQKAELEKLKKNLDSLASAR